MEEETTKEFRESARSLYRGFFFGRIGYRWPGYVWPNIYFDSHGCSFVESFSGVFGINAATSY